MRWRIVGGLIAVLATGLLLAGAATATFARAGWRTYPAGLSGASWIQAPGGAQDGYFRLPLDLPATPDLATLWIEADQQYQVYANGSDVAASLRPTASGRPQAADPVDLSGRLRKGRNGIGVEIVNGDGGPAVFRAQLTLDFGGKQVSYSTSAGSWLAAATVQQVRYPGSDKKDASFSAAAFDAGQWSYAAQATAAQPAQAVSLMPPAVVAGPLEGQVISAGSSDNMLAESVIQVPPDVSYAWLRVVASDAYTLSVDGHVVADQPAAYFASGRGAQPPQAAVNLFDIQPYLQAGSNLLQVHVYGSQRAAIYLDGVVDAASGPALIATGSGWHATGSALLPAGQLPSAAAVVLGPVNRVWPHGVRRTGVGAEVLITDGRSYALIAIALVLALWLGAAAAAVRAARRPFGRALLADAAGHLPALAAAAAVATLARLPNWAPPHPYSPLVFWLLVGILTVGKLGALGGSAVTSRGLPGPLARLPLLRGRGGEHPAATAAMDGQTAHWRSAGTAVPHRRALGRLPFPPQLAMAEGAAQAGAVPVGVDTRPTWRSTAVPARLGLLQGQADRLAARMASQLTWATGGVILIALASIGQLAYGLGYEPYSGDETVSLLAAQSIRAHLLPRFPSGLFYFKGELYEYLLAAYTSVVGQGPVALRLLTVLTYGATVLAFGLLLLPIVLKWEHRLAQVMLTLLFATAPMELQEAQLVRMYQQEQLFAILFVSFFLLALQTSRAAAGLGQQPAAPDGRLWTLAARWSIPLSAVTLVGMYLSLEESFILLPAIPVVLVGGLGLRWLRDRRWLRWWLPAAAVIGIQYLLTIVTKMPALGFDRSNKPYIYFDPSNFYYYLAHYLLAIPGGTGGVPAGSGSGTLYLLTTLAVLAGAVGIARRAFGRLYLSAFCLVPLLVLGTLFSAYAERYTLILLPMLFALGGLAALDILRWLRALFTATGEAGDTGQAGERRLVAGLILAAAVPGFVLLAASFPARLQDYGLTLSRLAGIPYSQQQPSYVNAAAYMRAHEEPGDLFITLASTTATAYYAGRPPDMIIQPHLNKLLYLTEKNGVVIDVYYGKPVILTAEDLEQVIATHPRIWLMTDQGPYFDSVQADMTQLIRAQFTEVAGNATTALYFRGSQ
ncbi:MAG: hypothetical protein ABSA02_28615 [Trebonia sp.]|jgi:hypothetical protein